ncbi:MAG: hypothetical protein ACLUI3_04635 [Christensenellales bacterium]
MSATWARGRAFCRCCSAHGQRDDVRRLVQPDVADMARRSVALNGLERIRVHCADCREAAVIGHETVQLVVTNPPYTAQGAGLVSLETTRAFASDSDCPLADWMAACACCCKTAGGCVPSFLRRDCWNSATPCARQG